MLAEAFEDAVPLAALQKAFEEGNWYQYLIPAAEALNNYEEVFLDMDTEADILHGRRIPAEPGPHDAMGKAVSEQGELIALLEYLPETGEWKPRKVFYQ